jgi:peptidylprolyl isomerase
MRRFAATLVVIVVLLAACGSDDSSDGANDTGDGTDTASSSLDAVTVEGAVGEVPIVTVPHPFSVEETASKVLVEGGGDELTAGATVGFHYAAVNGRDGELFDSSYAKGPVSGVLDETQILPGLVKGLVGKTVGSRVLIAMPPADAFGSQGAEEVGVQADDTLLFVVDVRELRHPLARAEGAPVAPVEGLPQVTLEDDGRPNVAIPGTDPPTELVAQLLIEGNGAAVEAGQTITVHYTGIVWATSTQFDSSWDRASPATFPIGSGSVIKGWDAGLVGQKVGSQVLLVVPPDQGYGSEGNPSAGITGTDTLVFVVDILDSY